MKISFVILCSAGLLAGCASGPPYDAVAAVGIRNLVFSTKSVVEDGDAGRLSLVETRKFIKQSQAQVQVVRSRTVEGQLSADELTLLDSLDQQYRELLRHNRPLRTSTAIKLTATLFALQDMRPIPDRTPRIAASDNSIDDISTPDPSSSNSKDCGKGGDHSDHSCGCDHGHR